MGKERIVLENDTKVSFIGRHGNNRFITDADIARSRVNKTRNKHEGGGFA